MFKFKVNKSLQLNGENSKTQEDYFNLSKICAFGFPHKPTALAWDPYLSLMAIGTHNGHVKIYGAPGVVFSGEHKYAVQITNLIFLPKQGRVVSLCIDNSLHLWELQDIDQKCSLVETKSFTLSGMMKKITSVYLKLTNDIIFLGTMCGNIYTLSVESFELAESVIYHDVVIQSVPENVKLNQGGVKVISERPSNPDSLLIGYQNGLIVLWDIKSLVVISTFVSSQGLESVSWHRKGDRFMSSHCDGSYVIWSTEDPSKPAEVPITLYGPFACKAIHRILWRSVKGGDDYIIFSGGMPRAVHGEKFTVSILCGDKHQVLDLSSRVVDFFTISDTTDESDFDNPHSLVILLEEELIALDLESDSWLPYRLPYLDIPHSSPVTCATCCPEVHLDTARLLKDVSFNGSSELYSESEWPIKGGRTLQDSSLVNSLLVTSHENGAIRLWNLSPSSMQLLHSFHTANTFITYERSEDSDELEDWPPFRKMGNYDSSCDDSRLAIRKMVFNDITKTLIAGGMAGHILVLTLVDTEAEKDIKPTVVHLGGEYSGTIFSGHTPLMLRPGLKKYSKGFHLQALVQLTPPVPITALAYHSEWNIFAAGTSHGFLLFDVIQRRCIMSKSTLGIGDASISASGELTQRSQTIKRSLRESFRKLRKGKILRNGRDRSGSLSSELTKDSSQDDSSKRDSFASSPDPTIASSPSPELRSFASESESHQSNGSLASVVQCVYLAQSFIINNVITSPTFWAGTSNGCIHIYTITMPTIDNRTTELVSCQPGREIQLRHRAPILSIQIVDHRGYPLPDPLEVQQQRTKPADLCRSHRVIICTEEQIKVFTLPSMKPHCKYKLTLLERCHIAQVGFATFQSKSDARCTENCLVCLANTREISLYNIPDLKKRMSFQCIPTEEIGILSSFLFVRDGRFIFMTSLSEFEMWSLSAAIIAQAFCSVEIPESARVPIKREDIVLQVHDIVADDRNSREPTNGHVDDGNSRADCAAGGDGAQSLIQGVMNSLNNSANGGGASQSTNGNVRIQIKRAPLARIDELSSSDEHQSSHSE